MNILEQIANGIENGREQFERIKVDANSFSYAEKHVYDTSAIESELALGDNVSYMKYLIEKGYSGQFQLLYLDPPFFTKAKYNATVSVRDADRQLHKIHHLAYDDRFERNLEFYVENMTVRILAMKELLSDTGLIWIHLDWHSSHYMKLILDELMGEKNFVNEIIWSYKSGGSGKRHFSKKHDTILVYSKTDKYKIYVPEEKSYNRGFKPYHFKGVKEYQDENGWYTLVNMKDVWTIDMVGRTSKERTGYATQKPLELMRRIIDSSTREGDLVGDFFAGSGSFLEAAEKMGRRWVGCDNEELATAMAKKRLDSIESNYMYRTETMQPLRLGCIDVSLNMEEELLSGKKMYSYAICGFRPEIDMGYIQMSDRPFVEDALATDSLQFIDYVMIDPDYRDHFSCEIVVEEGFDNLRFISRGNIAFVVVDVLGKEYFYRV